MPRGRRPMRVKPEIRREMPRLGLLPPPDEGFWIVVDTREQAPWFQGYPNVVVKKLDVGDYSLKGFEDEVAIERKSVTDLLGCIGKERRRFERELERMRGYRFKALVVEGTEEDIYTSSFTQLPPSTIRWSLMSFMIRWGLQLLILPREQAERWVFDMLYYYYTRKREGKI